MTSANPGGEPLVIDNQEAINRLMLEQKIADSILMHNRDVVVRADDSVVRVLNNNQSDSRALQFIRRARGYTPKAIQLHRNFSNSPSVLAVGGYFKNTVCVTRQNQAFVSQHLGSLDNLKTCEFFEETIKHLLDILEVKPKLVACDLHPDFYSTQFAQTFAHKNNLQLIPIQHHHAHIAAVLAEHQKLINNPVLALAMDGVGLGNSSHDNQTNIWGGELMLITNDINDINRIGHLQEIILPGGDLASKNPWRIAAGILYSLGKSELIKSLYANQSAVYTLIQMLTKNINCPRTTSAGRLFDAVCGLLLICETMSFEGQAPMILEGLAQKYLQENGGIKINHNWEIIENNLSMMPYFNNLIFDIESNLHQKKAIDKSFYAAQFHLSFANALFDWLQINLEKHHAKTVVLSGGCFLNKLLTQIIQDKLTQINIKILVAKQVPPNDGGLSLGQAYLALNKLS